jgi:hypothetical protein
VHHDSRKAKAPLPGVRSGADQGVFASAAAGLGPLLRSAYRGGLSQSYVGNEGKLSLIVAQRPPTRLPFEIAPLLAACVAACKHLTIATILVPPC